MDIFSLLNPDFKPCFSHEKIPAWALHAFSQRIKAGPSGTLFFAHQNIQGRITGWEVGDLEFRGERSLFFVHMGSNAGRILIAPRAMMVIDFFSRRGMPNDICVSTAGEIAPFQAETLRALCKGSPVITCSPPGDDCFPELVLAFASHAEVVTDPQWALPKAPETPSLEAGAAPARALGDPGDPVTIEQLDAIFSETNEDSPRKGRGKQEKNPAPLLAFF